MDEPVPRLRDAGGLGRRREGVVITEPEAEASDALVAGAAAVTERRR